MKKNIHPEYYEVVASCHCGAQFKIGSTLKEVHVDICSKCHPIFKGEKNIKVLDSEGRIGRFKKRYSSTKILQEKAKEREKRKELVVKEEEERKKRKQERIIGKTSTV